MPSACKFLEVPTCKYYKRHPQEMCYSSIVIPWDIKKQVKFSTIQKNTGMVVLRQLKHHKKAFKCIHRIQVQNLGSAAEQPVALGYRLFFLPEEVFFLNLFLKKYCCLREGLWTIIVNKEQLKLFVCNICLLKWNTLRSSEPKSQSLTFSCS